MSTTPNDRRTRRLPRILLNQAIVGLIMFLVAASILFYAQGYRFNWKSFKLIKTGVISISSSPKNALVYIDGKLADNRTPFHENLSAGFYRAEVQQDGYQGWSVLFKIEPELVTSYSSVVLFKSSPKIEILTDESKVALLDTPFDNLAGASPALIATGYEIWLGDNLLTRFSSPIYHAVLYPDRAHVVYQQGDEIRIIDADAKYDSLLVKLSQSTATRFITNAKGDELYYLDSGKYYVAYIR